MGPFAWTPTVKLCVKCRKPVYGSSAKPMCAACQQKEARSLRKHLP